MFKVIIAGSRTFDNYDLLREKMYYFLRFKDSVCVVCGMAKGADALGYRFAKEHNIPVDCFPADWDKHGKKAGYLRNLDMAENADALVAFWDGKSVGTKHMIDIAKRKGLEVRVVYV